jgi:hypothetical protein
MKLFDKLKSGGERLFDKIKNGAPRILGKVSDALNQGSNILNKGVQFGSNLMKNPLVQAGATALGFGPEMLGANSLIKAANKGSALLNSASELTNKNNYKGDANTVSANILERMKQIKNDAKDPNHGINFQ